MTLGIWWLKPPWKPVLGFLPLGCCFGSCTTSDHQSCCDHNWIECGKVNYQFLRNSTVYAFTLLLLKCHLYLISTAKEKEEAQMFHFFQRPKLGFTECQRWKDLKYLVRAPHMDRLWLVKKVKQDRSWGKHENCLWILKGSDVNQGLHFYLCQTGTAGENFKGMNILPDVGFKKVINHLNHPIVSFCIKYYIPYHRKDHLAGKHYV